jgi:hypothetical protein
MIKPIKQYSAYFFAKTGKLYGLTESTIDTIDVIDQDGDDIFVIDFFTKSGNLYFQILEDSDGESSVHFYQQKQDKIAEIDVLPEKPVKTRAHYNSKEFTITDFKFEDEKCSDVKNIVTESGVERFFNVDGFYHFEGYGIFFNVKDGRYNEEIVVRDNGLYFWGINDKGIDYLVGDGSLWK